MYFVYYLIFLAFLQFFLSERKLPCPNHSNRGVLFLLSKESRFLSSLWTDIVSTDKKPRCHIYEKQTNDQITDTQKYFGNFLVQ